MTLGFTGTRKGMTQRQRDTVLYLFRELQLTELHHGGERHADSEAHRLALALGVSVHVHPGPAFKLSHDCLGADIVYEHKPNLTRNKDIVTMGVDGLVAAPRDRQEEQRSGTWATVRYARKEKRRIWHVYPDGTFKEEQGEWLHAPTPVESDAVKELATFVDKMERVKAEAIESGTIGTSPYDLNVKRCCDGNDPACPTHGVAASNARQNKRLKEQR